MKTWFVIFVIMQNGAGRKSIQAKNKLREVYYVHPVAMSRQLLPAQRLVGPGRRQTAGFCSVVQTPFDLSAA